jgi:acetate---CoA ligase (ADP-forming)
MRAKSIAVVGASPRGSRGTRVLHNLRNTKFAGGVYAINPKYDEILDFPCFPKVSSIDGGVDCVVVSIPAQSVGDVLQDAYDAGTRAAVVLSAGFGEGGQADQGNLDKLAELSRQGMAICGPNCYGVLNVMTGAAAFSGPTDDILPGNVAVLSQSGGFSTMISEPLMRDRGIGCSYIVSCGNQLGVSVEEYLEFFIEDEKTQVVAGFIEGFKDVGRLRDVAIRARNLGKRIVLLKSGRSQAGSVAVMSHTGSLAGSAVLTSAMLRKYGIVEVDTIDELIETTAFFSTVDTSLETGREIIVITGSGGESSHFADAADAAQLELASLNEPLKQRLRNLLPNFGVVNNPIDGTGAMFEDPSLFPNLLRAVIEEQPSAIVAVNLSGRAPANEDADGPMRGFARAMAELAPHSASIILGYSTSARGIPDRKIVDTLQNAGVPFVSGTTMAISSLSSITRLRSKSPSFEVSGGNENAKAGLRGNLSFVESKDLLERFGITVSPTFATHTFDEALAQAQAVGFPVVLKGDARDLLHRSDIGVVKVGINNADELVEAYVDISRRMRERDPSGNFEILVQPMASGVECVAGITVDPIVGPGIMFGLGGIFVEVLRDVVFEVLPIDHGEALDMINSVAGAALLRGARGKEPVDLHALADLLVSLGDLATTYAGSLETIDLNPIMASSEGVIAVDALIAFHHD